MAGKKKMKTETGSHLTNEYHFPNPNPEGNEEEEEEENSYSELEAVPPAKRGANSSNCGESTKSQGADTQPSWRPPMPIECAIWKPIHVKTNGEGRERLLCAEPLVEVYEVKVDLCGKTHGHIHGKIILDCTMYRTYLFNCDQESALMIHNKGSLPLKGPDIAPVGYDRVTIIVDLNVDDDKLCEGMIKWNPVHYLTDQWLYDEIKGTNGSVQVSYFVMNNAWLGELGVKLIKPTKGTTGFRIHGDIIVYINDMTFMRDFVFSKRNGDCFTIKSEEPFPLSRSLFCCRLGSSLVVKVDLWNSDTNEPFVHGALLFPPEYYGDSVGKLRSQDGEIEVTVNWVLYRDHSKTSDALRCCHPWIDMY